MNKITFEVDSIDSVQFGYRELELSIYVTETQAEKIVQELSDAHDLKKLLEEAAPEVVEAIRQQAITDATGEQA